jgi:hypothetical protein
VFQSHVASADQSCFICQLPPGASSQNRYSAELHPVAAALNVTVAPGSCGDAGLAVTFTPLQVGGADSTYDVSLYACHDPLLPAALTQTECA